MYKVILILDKVFLKYEGKGVVKLTLHRPGKITLKKPSLIRVKTITFIKLKLYGEK